MYGGYLQVQFMQASSTSTLSPYATSATPNLHFKSDRVAGGSALIIFTSLSVAVTTKWETKFPINFDARQRQNSKQKTYGISMQLGNIHPECKQTHRTYQYRPNNSEMDNSFYDRILVDQPVLCYRQNLHCKRIRSRPHHVDKIGCHVLYCVHGIRMLLNCFVHHHKSRRYGNICRD